MRTINRGMDAIEFSQDDLCGLVDQLATIENALYAASIDNPIVPRLEDLEYAFELATKLRELYY